MLKLHSHPIQWARMRKQKAEQLGEGEVLLLENLRFSKEEEKNDPEFAKELASLRMFLCPMLSERFTEHMLQPRALRIICPPFAVS